MATESKLGQVGMHRRPNTDAPEYVYKILDANDWRHACERGQYVGSEDDKRDGFIHLSAAHQLAGTVAKYFSGKRNLLLVVFAADDLGESLKWGSVAGRRSLPSLLWRLANWFGARQSRAGAR